MVKTKTVVQYTRQDQINLLKFLKKFLDFFYNKGVRKDNLTPYTKKRNLSEKDIIEFAGVVDGTRSKDENRYYQQNLLGLFRLFDRVFTNQELRIEGGKRNENIKSLREGMSDIMFSKAEGAKTFNMVEKPSDVEIPLVSIQLLKDLLEGKTRTGFRDMDAEFEPGVTFDQKASGNS